MQFGAARYGSEDAFEARFEGEFGSPVPETVNALQRVLVVAPTVDDATAFVIEYLAETYRVPINAVSFDVFGDGENQILVRHFAIEESTPTPPPVGTKTRQTETWDDVFARARSRNRRDHRTLSEARGSIPAGAVVQ